MTEKKVLVTGATGFTGGKVAERLVAMGDDVVAFVRASSNTAALEALGVECRVVDIRAAADVAENFADIGKVFHIAAAYRSEHADHAEFVAVNVEATRNLLDSAVRAGVDRFVHCSTVGVQGEIEDPPAAEDYRFNPGDHYQQSKLDGELLALQYFRDGLPGCVVRPVGIYGPGDTRFLKLFKPIQKGQFIMIGKGDVLYHMTYIDDLVDGFMLAGEKTAALGEVFTIAGPQYTTIRELVDAIADVLDKPHPRLRVPFTPVYLASVVCDRLFRAVNLSPPLYPRRVEFFELDRAFSTAKAEQALGYSPKVSLADGLARTAAWYREQGLI
ncbi:MAG TPA: NAD-dependent epimerase/dehydratase family protein [Woeseiaceae bacterium]|nr:NAD-dependent epimerase/dehydratase family protein [Woeseiaceae bacterium]